MRFLSIEDVDTDTAVDDNSDEKKASLDSNEAAQAAQAVENQDSTEPAKVLQVANYKEELQKILDQQGINDTTSGDNNGQGSGSDISSDTSSDVNGTGDTGNDGSGDGLGDTGGDMNLDSGSDTTAVSDTSTDTPTDTDKDTSDKKPEDTSGSSGSDTNNSDADKDKPADDDQNKDNSDNKDNQDTNKENNDNENKDEKDDDQQKDDQNNSSSENKEDKEKSDKEPATESYIKHMMDNANLAFESITEMLRYKQLIDKRERLGGLDQSTASVIINVLKYNCDRVGLKSPKPTPALESYSSYTSSKQATRQLKVAVEDFVKEVWEFIKKLFRALVKFFTNLLDEDKIRVQEHGSRDKLIENLRTKINNLQDKEAKQKLKEQELEMFAGVAKALFKTGDKGKVEEIQQNIKNFESSLDISYNIINNLSDKFTTVLRKTNLPDNDKPENIIDLTLNEDCIRTSSLKLEHSNINKYISEAKTEEILSEYCLTIRYIKSSPLASDVSNLGETQLFNLVKDVSVHYKPVQSNKSFPKSLNVSDSSERRKISDLWVGLGPLDAKLKNLKETLEASCKMANETAESNNKSRWDNLSPNSFTYLQKQFNTITVLSAKLGTFYDEADTKFRMLHKGINGLLDNYNHLFEEIVK